MAKGSNPFQLADADKRKLSKETQRKIKELYENVAKNLEDKLSGIDLSKRPSDSIRQYYLEYMQKEIEQQIDRLESELNSTIQNSSKQSGQLVVDAQNAVMAKAGLKLEGAYGYIPEQVVKNLLSGGLYKGNWSLSQSIWKAGSKVKSDVQKVIAEGLAENKSVKDIADDLVKYLRPSARKPWDWSKVYPGTTEKVDYNAQRLARTMIQHAYQQSMLESMKYNPFCKGVIWHSVFAHGRTCQLCRDRDGVVYSLKKLPLDHPNGLCYFEPALDDMNSIADSLADWVKGGKNKGIDNYVEHAFM